MAFDKKTGKMIPYESRWALYKDLMVRVAVLWLSLAAVWFGFYAIHAGWDWFPGYSAAAYAWRGLTTALAVLSIPFFMFLAVSTLFAGWGGDAKEENDD